MATKYTFNFTDTSKPSFDVQSYTANGLDIPSSPAVVPGASAANTTLKLYGRGLKDYGEGVFQDMIYMLENFANSARPYQAIEGQLWYNNAVGSPPTSAELFIRNNTGDGSDLIGDWDAVILATGTSTMTGHLTLIDQPPTADYHAVPLTYLTGPGGHFSDTTIHIDAAQNTFLDGLTLGSPNLTSGDVNQLIGITSNVQTQLNSKLNLSGGAMTGSITFITGEVLGLPAVPSVDGASASKKYVDDEIASGAGGDGVLTSTQWLNTGIGSPAPIINENTLELTVTFPNLSTTLIEVEGIARVGHTHDALDVIFNNAFNTAYPTNTQDAIEYADTIKANLLNPVFTSGIQVLGTIVGNTATFGNTVTAVDPVGPLDLTTKQYVDTLVGGATPVAGAVPGRQFEILASDIISPATYSVQQHQAGDDTLSITINGIKQYLSVRGIVDILFAPTAIALAGTAPTGLDQTLNYEFDIAVDGAPATTITLLAATDTSNHGLLATAINAVMGGSPPTVDAEFRIKDTVTETFTTLSQGTGSSIVISDPGGANTYLFDVDLAPDAIVDATFYSDPVIPNTGSPPDVGTPLGSPPVARPDTIEIVGDFEADYPVGKLFAIRGSDEINYGTYDGIYSVHVQGANFNGTNTVISVANFSNPTLNIALLPGYVPPTGSPVGSPVAAVPAPAPFGSNYISPLVGIDQIATPVDGIEGDYMETDASGNTSTRNELTSEIVFNYDILTGSKIESLSFA